MKWGRRIKLYLIGFGLGLLMCWLFFFRNGNNRDLGGWMPNSRVTTFIAKAKKLEADSSLLCKIKCEGITLEDIRKSAVAGEVDFDKSQAQKEPCHEYDIKANVKGKALELYFSACMSDSSAKLLYVNPPLSGNACGCE